MKPTVYIETSIVSYLKARPTSNVVRQGHHEITRRWWQDRRPDFALFTSQLVPDEAVAGDAQAAADRLSILQSIDPLDIHLPASNRSPSSYYWPAPSRPKRASTPSTSPSPRPTGCNTS